MAVLVVAGRVTKCGTGEYGDWYIVAETVRKRDGDTFEKRYMCSGKDTPEEGQHVVVQGFARAKVTERDGEHYADINVNAAQFTVIGSEPGAQTPQQEFSDAEIPF